MHEISLVRSVFNTIEAEFDTEELAKITAIDLKVGLLSNVEPLLLQNAFEAVTTAEDKFQDVTLNTIIIPIEIHCEQCNENSLIENYKFVCKTCQKPNNNLIHGTELLIHQIHFGD